VLTELYMN